MSGVLSVPQPMQRRFSTLLGDGVGGASTAGFVAGGLGAGFEAAGAGEPAGTGGGLRPAGVGAGNPTADFGVSGVGANRVPQLRQ